MPSGRGAGLMLLPILRKSFALNIHHDHSPGMMTAMTALPIFVTSGGAWLAVALHTLGYLAVTALAATFISEKLGLELLRKAWLNLDLVWALALSLSGVLVLIV
jgi:hypothetical protein